MAAAFVGPAAALLLSLLAIPVVGVFAVSFTEWAGLSFDRIEWVGLRNFAQMTTDPVLGMALAHTIIFTVVTTIVLNLIGLGYALLLDTRVRGTHLFRSVMFLPVLLSPVIVGMMWTRILDPFGPLNQLLSLVGLSKQPVFFLGDEGVALPAIMLAVVWQFAGFNALLYYAGLQSAPRDLIDAARADGANSVALIRHVLIPTLYPVIATLVLLNTIAGFKVFDLVYVMTAGGPNRSTEVLATYMYQVGFRFGEMGYAASIAVLIATLSIGLAAIRMWNRRV